MGNLGTGWVFVGRFERDSSGLTVIGVLGEVHVRGSDQELAEVARRLSLTTEPLVDDRWAGLGEALTSVGAAVDPARAWFWFQMMSSNPPVVLHPNDPMGAYKLPRFSIEAPSIDPIGQRAPTDVNETAARRTSANLGESNFDPALSFESALRLAGDAYETRPGGTRPVASGGALYPLHFWVVGPVGEDGDRAVRYVDHDAGVHRIVPAVKATDFALGFVPDVGVEHALGAGAAVVLIAADPTRVTYKYGNRGWRYAMMEVGAVAHHMHLNATERGTSLRPVAGFVEERLSAAVTAPCFPLLTIFVGEFVVGNGL